MVDFFQRKRLHLKISNSLQLLVEKFTLPNLSAPHIRMSMDLTDNYAYLTVVHPWSWRCSSIPNLNLHINSTTSHHACQFMGSHFGFLFVVGREGITIYEHSTSHPSNIKLDFLMDSFPIHFKDWLGSSKLIPMLKQLKKKWC